MISALNKFVGLGVFFIFLTSFLNANDFLEGVEEFEAGNFRASFGKLKPLAEQGDLFARMYITRMVQADRTLCPEGLSFKDAMEVRCLDPLRDDVESSVVKLRYTGKGASFGIPQNGKKGEKDLSSLLKRNNPGALIVMGDLLLTGQYKKSLPVPKSEPKCYYGEAIKQSGDYRAILKLKALGGEYSSLIEILTTLQPLGARPSQADIYFKLFRHYEGKSMRPFAKMFCYRAAYHGHGEAQFQLTQKGYLSDVDEADFWITQSAYQGHPTAIRQLAYIYQKRNEFEKAFEIYSNSAQNAEAQNLDFYNLAVCYEKGKGTPVNLGEALKWYYKAYGKEEPEGTIHDADIFHAITHILLCTKNAKAERWLHEGMRQGDQSCILNYAIYAYENPNQRESPHGVLSILKSFPSYTSDSRALDLLSNLLIKDKQEGTPFEWEQVENGLKKKLKEKGIKLEDFETTAYFLSCVYSTGRNGKLAPNYAEAAKYLDLGISKGSAICFFQRGQLHEFGPEPKHNKAFDCYLKAAQGGFDCWNNLGVYYMNGEEGVSQNDKEAVTCFTKAMKSDQNGLAHHNYALMLWENRGGLVFNEPQFIDLLKRSAELGDITAWNDLGIYFSRKSTTEDLRNAMQFFEEGVQKGNTISRYYLNFLKVETSQDIESSLTRLEKLKEMSKEESDPVLLMNCALLFMKYKHLNPTYKALGESYLEQAIRSNSEEARYLKVLLDQAKKQSAEAPDLLGAGINPADTAAALTNAIQAESQPSEEADSGPKGAQAEALDEEAEFFEEDEEEPQTHLGTGKKATRKREMSVSKDSRNAGHPSKKIQRIMDFLDQKSTKPISVHEVFSMIGDLIKEKGGSLRPSTRGVRIQVGAQKIFMHLRHKKGQSGYGGDMVGGRLDEARDFMRAALGAAAASGGAAAASQ